MLSYPSIVELNWTSYHCTDISLASTVLQHLLYRYSAFACNRNGWQDSENGSRRARNFSRSNAAMLRRVSSLKQSLQPSGSWHVSRCAMKILAETSLPRNIFSMPSETHKHHGDITLFDTTRVRVRFLWWSTWRVRNLLVGCAVWFTFAVRSVH